MFLYFRAIYECDDPLKFMNQLEQRIKHHDKEIERMCNNYYQGFIDSIRDLQQVRNQAKNLNVSYEYIMHQSLEILACSSELNCI